MQTIRSTTYKARKEYYCSACDYINNTIGYDEFLEVLTTDEKDFFTKIIERKFRIQVGEKYDYSFVVDCGECWDYRAIIGMTELCWKYDIFED